MREESIELLGGSIRNYTQRQLIEAKGVIPSKVVPVKTGQTNTGFRVKPGMTNEVRLMESCIDKIVPYPLFQSIDGGERPSEI